MNPYQNLLYCRQYIMCKKEIPEFSDWNIYLIHEFRLYVHPDLKVTNVKKKNREIFLLGSIFSYTRENETYEEILEQLVQSEKFEDLLQKSEYLTGRYVIIYVENSSVKIFHDPSAARKVNYYVDDNEFCFATQPFMIAKIFNIPKTQNLAIQQFYNSPEFEVHCKVGVTNNTSYDPIKLLLPNYYIDVEKKKAIRFWPYRNLSNISLNEGVDRASRMLKGFIRNIHQRNKLTMAITSGNDSRLLLAASRDISDDVLYYIYQLPRMKDESHCDIQVPGKMLNRVNLKLQVVTYNSEVDEDFKEIYIKNNEFYSLDNLPIIYNFMYKQCSDRLNLSTSMSDVMRNFFSSTKKEMTPELLAKIWRYDDIKYVIDQYKDWLNEVEPLATEFGYNILDLFNWEERMANWTAYYESDSDIAQDNVSPLCSRKLLEIMLSVPAKYRDFNTNVLHRTMIYSMWPELSEFPYNPIMKRRISYTLKKAKVYWLVRSLVRGW